jgi:DNA-binding response OmpR family regulator
MKILLIEDSSKLQRSISMGLEKAGYKIDVTGDGEEGLWYIESGDYDVVVLDLMLPNLDGISILKKIRENENPVHVLILSAKDTLDDRINGLEYGADDYLVKPFAFEELLARIKSLVRRKYKVKSNIITIDDLTININKRTVIRNNKYIDLSPREYALLEYLALNKGKVISRTEIEEHIYDEYVEPFSNVIDAAICYLRNKIDIPNEKSIITTKRGHGYIIDK